MYPFLLSLVLAVHLLLVDLAMAGPLVCVWLEWRATRKGDASAEGIGGTLARLSVWALVGGSVLGGLLLAIRWQAGDDSYFTALTSVPASRLWFGGAELLFSLALLIGYRLLWIWRRHLVLHRLLAIAASSNLMIHFPALFLIVSAVHARGAPSEGLSAADYRRMLIDPEVISRVTHVWLGAIAIAAAAVVVLSLRRSSGESVRSPLTAQAARLGLAATALQLPSGIWVALTMSFSERQQLFGGDLLATSFFMASLVLALQLLHTFTAIAMGDPQRKHVKQVLLIVPVLMYCMVASRVQGRASRPVAAASDDLPPAIASAEVDDGSLHRRGRID